MATASCRRENRSMRLDQEAEYPQPPEMGAGSEFCSRTARSVNRKADKISRHSNFLLLHMWKPQPSVLKGMEKSLVVQNWCDMVKNWNSLFLLRGAGFRGRKQANCPAKRWDVLKMKLSRNACWPTCILEEGGAMPYPLSLWGTHFSLTLPSFLPLFFSSTCSQSEELSYSRS